MHQPKSMWERLEETSPYNIFYNAVRDLPQTHFQSNSITFKDLLCPSLGELKCSLFMACKTDIKWLKEQFELMNLGNVPLTLLHSQMKENDFENVSTYFIEKNHSRLGILVYKDGSLRVVLFSANLTQTQWDEFNQGVWVSPLCPPLPQSSPNDSGESPTNFKSALITCLERYNRPSVLHFWINTIKRANFSDVRVFLVTSVRGFYRAKNSQSHLQQLENLLKAHCELPDNRETWPIVAQSPNLGRYGESPTENWLNNFFLKCLASHNTPLKIIYPTKKQMKKITPSICQDGKNHYNKDPLLNQQYVKDYLHVWKADKLGRTGIFNNCKLYFRVSPCYTKMAWFLFTSVNIARTGWGGRGKNYQWPDKNDNINVSNHELGILFIPKFFGEDYFDTEIFPVIFDLPLEKYKEDDIPCAY